MILNVISIATLAEYEVCSQYKDFYLSRMVILGEGQQTSPFVGSICGTVRHEGLRNNLGRIYAVSKTLLHGIYDVGRSDDAKIR